MSTMTDETCQTCHGIGHTGIADYDGNFTTCGPCNGWGRVPVPMRDCTKDAVDERQELLEKRLASALSILKLIAKHDSSEGRLAASALAILEA